MAVTQTLSAVVLLCSCLQGIANAAPKEPSNSSSRSSGIDAAIPVIAPPPSAAYNLYRKQPSHLSSRQVSFPEQPSSPSPDNQSSTADINQPIIGTQAPGTDALLNTAAPFGQQPQFPAGQGQLPDGFNFGSQPRQFDFGFGPPGYNQDTNIQPVGIPPQGTNGFQQNFPPLNFRTSGQLTNQFNAGQSGSPLPNAAAQQNFGQYTGNVNTLPGAIPQVQGFGQFNGFQFSSSNIGQGFPQQFNYPNFGPGGLYNTENQSLVLSPSGGDQRSVVGFYGEAPNIGGYTFNGAPLQGQQPNLFPGGFVGPNIGQFGSGDSQIPSGAPQLGATGGQGANAFSSLSFNAAAFPNGGVAQDAGFSSTVSELKNVPVPRQHSQTSRK